MKHLVLILALLIIAPVITCHAQEDTIAVDSVPALSDADLYALGLQNGRNDWNKRGPGIGALGCGILPIYGVFLVPFLAVSKPRPEVKDMLPGKPFSSPLYLMAWTKGAHKKKARRVMGNFFIGIGIVGIPILVFLGATGGRVI